MEQTNYLIFLCYGNERVFHECTYALLSLSRLYSADELRRMEIWIYTDDPNYFEGLKGCKLPLNYRAADSELIKAWRGKIDFVHRVKIEILKDLAKSKKGNFLYADTDVVFTHKMEEVLKSITAGNLYMHIMEGRVSSGSNPIFRKLNNYLAGQKEMLNGKPLNEMMMWNAGVLGFNTSHVHLLDEVLNFTDRVYPEFPKHVVEQFAFSAYFQDAAIIKTAAPYIFHYWNMKEAGLILASFFHYFEEAQWDELVRYSKLIQMATLMQEKVVYLSNQGVGEKLAGKKWAPAQPDWKELVAQL